MKLYTVINQKKYEVGVGSTFSEEYNETLDSGALILDQIPRIYNLKPYDDVFVYSEPIILSANFVQETHGIISLRGTYLRIKGATLKGLKSLSFVVSSSPRIPSDSSNKLTYTFEGIASSTSTSFTLIFRVSGSLDSGSLPLNPSHPTSNRATRIFISFNLGTYQGEPAWTGKVSTHTSTGDNPRFFFLTQKPTFTEFYKHMLVDDFSEELNNVISKEQAKYKYKINLFSETKRLEKVILPNISITQPVDKGIRRSVWEYLNVYINLYSPKIKVVDDQEAGTWKYENKYSLADRVRVKFEGVDAPEMSVTNPTLRDIITQLMLVKDCIPVVHDDVIDYLDVSERNGEFSTNPQYVNYVHSSMSSGGYSLEARREYSGAISQENSARLTEYLGFRNSNTSVLTIENLVLETRFPIYKINKIYMCYYKTAKIFDSIHGNLSNEIKFLCKQDITDLVLQNIVRNAMSQDYVQFEYDITHKLFKTTKDISKYKVCTLGYDIGSNRITGWGEKYQFYPINNNLFDGWFTATHTILENIIRFVDLKTPLGVRGYQFLTQDNITLSPTNISVGGLSSIVTDGEFGDSVGILDINNNSVRQKAVFFEIDYNAMFSGSIVHTKDDVDDDDITTADNCSSSLTVLEADGLFEKEKMNRFANRTYNIQARYNGYDAFEKMETTCNHVLGSVYKNEDEGIDDVIIYHREISVFDNFILANFAGTYDYVLKNYFTSVFAKLRTYNLATYGESVMRSENYREYILLSKEECYYDGDSIVYPYIDTFASSLKETQKNDGIDSFDMTDQINFSYIQYKNDGENLEINKSRSFSDTNVFISGKIICVNLKMYDNATTGVYITNSCLAELSESEQSRGSLQSWNVALDNVLDPFQENVVFGFGHLYTGDDIIPSGKTTILPESNYTSSVKTIYTDQLLKFPNFDEIDYLNNCARFYITIPEGKQLIYKDNKETIDFTFQFEPYSSDQDVILSSWFSKLNDWNGTYQKWSSTKLRNKSYTESLEIAGGFQKKNYVNNQWDGTISFVVKIQSSVISNLPDQGGIIYFADYETSKENPFFFHTFPPEGTEDETTKVNVVKTDYSYTDDIGRYGYIVYYRLVGAQKGIGNTVDLIVYYDVNKIYENGDIVNVSTDQEFRAVYNPDPQTSNLVVTSEGGGEIVVETFQISFAPRTNYFWQTTDQDIENSIFGLTFFPTRLGEKTTSYYYKNMFAIISSEPIRKEIVYDTYVSQDSEGTTLSGITFDNLPEEMTIINTDDSTNQYDSNTYIPFNELFSFARVNNFPKIKVGNSLLNNYPDHKSIQFWYLDNNGNSPEGRLQFVFGVNTEENETEVFVSAMSRKSPKIYSLDHKTIIGEIFNCAELEFFVEQNKMISDRYIGNIYYENINDSSDTGIIIDTNGYIVV